MPEYRLYCLDSAGKIHFAENFEAADDEQAVAKACELKNGATKCEVWDRNRFVASLDSDDLASRG